MLSPTSLIRSSNEVSLMFFKDLNLINYAVIDYTPNPGIQSKEDDKA